MTKMGIKEFRRRVSEVASGSELVEVTNNGRVVAEFTPVNPVRSTAEQSQWLEDRLAFRQRWQEETPDWFERLTDFGLDEEGEPLAEPTFR